MSQTETIMLIILGFAVALLLALILGKLLSGRSLGLGKRRVRRQDPVTIAGLQADKDKLRAEAAMQSRKLELRLNDLKTRLAKQTAEVSRNRNRIDYLVGEINERNNIIAKRDSDIEKLKLQMVPLEEELVARTGTIQQLKQQLRDAEDDLLDKEADLLDRHQEVVNKSILIDDLQKQLSTALAAARNVAKTATASPSPTPATNKPVIEEDILAPEDLSAKKRLQSRISDLTALSKQIEDQRLQLTRQHSQLKDLTATISTETITPNSKSKDTPSPLDQLNTSSTRLEKQLTEAEHETDVLQKELARLDEDWNEKLKKLEEVKSKPAEPAKPEKTAKPQPKAKKTTSQARKKPAKKPAKKASKQAGKKPASKSDSKPDTGDEQSNVATLATRIRSLQNDIKGQKK